jgi:DNA-binding MarR family transcriptional regulator
MVEDEYLGHLLGITANALTRKASNNLQDFDLTIRQIGVLKALYRENGLTSSELTERLGSDSSTVMALVDQLEKKGWIRREFSLKDRRIRHLVLTEKAQFKKESLVNRVEKMNRDLINQLSDDELVSMKKTLHKILRFALDE